MMMKRMWYELNILALRKHVRPVSLFPAGAYIALV